jgi:hypothetical protein
LGQTDSLQFTEVDDYHLHIEFNVSSINLGKVSVKRIKKMATKDSVYHGPPTSMINSGFVYGKDTLQLAHVQWIKCNTNRRIALASTELAIVALNYRALFAFEFFDVGPNTPLDAVLVYFARGFVITTYALALDGIRRTLPRKYNTFGYNFSLVRS